MSVRSKGVQDNESQRQPGNLEMLYLVASDGGSGLGKGTLAVM